MTQANLPAATCNSLINAMPARSPRAVPAGSGEKVSGDPDIHRRERRIAGPARQPVKRGVERRPIEFGAVHRGIGVCAINPDGFHLAVLSYRRLWTVELPYKRHRPHRPTVIARSALAVPRDVPTVGDPLTIVGDAGSTDRRRGPACRFLHRFQRLPTWRHAPCPARSLPRACFTSAKRPLPGGGSPPTSWWFP